jgi:SH3-like domain-containing protein
MVGEWAQVQYKGFYAYAVRALLSEFFTGNEASAGAAVSQASVPATVYAEWGRVNFRRQPDKAADVIMKLEPGTPVEVTGRAGSFCSVVYMGISGYIMSDYLIFGNEPQPTAEPIIQPNDASAAPATAVPLPQASPAPAAQPPAGQSPAYRNARVTTNGGTLNLREAPYAEAPVLVRMPQCAVVQAMEIDDRWCAVVYGGISGYAMKEYLTFGENYAPEVISGLMSVALPEYSIGPAVVNTPSGSLNLRAQPCPYSQVLTLLPKGETVEVYAIEGEWALVTFREYAGYVNAAYLETEQSDMAPEQPVG